jgi:hypothetical protein
MGQGIPQVTFASGELSPALYGRIDLAKYFSGLAECRNFIVRPTGGVDNRPGTAFIACVKDSTTKVRLIPFSFSTTQTYVLAFGNQYLWVFMNGGQVLYPAGNALAGQVVEVATPYLAADLPLLKFTQSADVMTITHPDYPTQQLSRTEHWAWSFARFANVNGPFQDTNIDESVTVYASGLSETVTVTANTALFTSSMVGMLMYIEEAPDATTPVWEVQQTIVLNQVVRAGQYYYQAMTAGVTGTVMPDHTQGSACDGNPGVSWKYLNSGSGIVQITGFTSPASVTANVLTQLPQNVVSVTVPQQIANVTPGGGYGFFYVVVTIPAHGYADGSSVVIAGVNGTQCNGAWVIHVIDSNNFKLVGCVSESIYHGGGTCSSSVVAVPTYLWAFESWGGNKSWPGTTAYYQQRQCFGGSADFPQTIWISRTAGYLDFGQNVVLLDDDAITFTVASREVNYVRHMIEMTDLIVLTSSGEWIVQGAANGVLTPSAISVNRQGYNGCSDVPPIVVNYTIIYIQSKGSQVRSLSYQFQTNSYVGEDVTVMSSHLFQGHTILEWAFQQIPFSCIWAVRDDGVLLGFTYMQEQQVAAWHRHDTDGLFESVCTIVEGNVDAVYVVVNRTIGGQRKRYVERFDNRQFTDVTDAFFVDAGLSWSGAPATVFSGLDHLEGQTVSILADGNVHPRRVVAGGSVTLDYAASDVHIGLPITAEIATLNLSVPGQNVLDKKKLISKVSLICQSSRGIMAGPDSDHLRQYKDQSGVLGTGSPIPVQTGMFEILTQAAWDKNGTVTVQQTDPLPLSILAVIPDVAVGGT